MASEPLQSPDRNPIARTTSLTDRVKDRVAVHSLGKVYAEMRTLYRSYRRRAGAPELPELRSAVRAYKRGPSLASLTHIATFLDDRNLLGW